MKTTILKIDDHDDVISICDKISGCRSNRVLLVLPRGFKVFREKMDLVLVQRHSTRLGAQLGLVTRDEQIASIAYDLGIAVFEDERNAQRKAWRRWRKVNPDLNRRQKIQNIIQQGKQSRVTIKRNTLPLSLRMIFFVVGLLGVFAMLAYLVPGAVIRLAPIEEEQTLKLDVWASLNVSSPTITGAVPAQIKTVIVDHEEAGIPSQTALVADQPSKGEITLENITDQDVFVPQGTIVITLSSPPIRFRTLEAITVPSGKDPVVKTAVEAVEAGSRGNVPAQSIGAIEGLIGLKLIVSNLEETRGGSDRESLAPSQADYDLLRQRSAAALKKKAMDALSEQLAVGEKMLIATLVESKLLEEKMDPPVGQPADRISLRIEAEYSVWIINERDILTVTESAMDAVLKSGYRSVPNSVLVTDLGEPKMDGSRILWDVFGVRKIKPNIPREAVLLAAAGRSKTDATAVIARVFKLKTAPVIELYPAWWRQMPFFEQRIHVEIQ